MSTYNDQSLLCEWHRKRAHTLVTIAKFCAASLATYMVFMIPARLSAGEIIASVGTAHEWVAPVEITNQTDSKLTIELQFGLQNGPQRIAVVNFELFEDGKWHTIAAYHDTALSGQKLVVEPADTRKGEISFQLLRRKLAFPALVRARLNVAGTPELVYSTPVLLSKSGEITPQVGKAKASK